MSLELLMVTSAEGSIRRTQSTAEAALWSNWPGIDENKVPHDIPLEWSEFVKAIGFNTTVSVETAKEKIEKKPIVKDEEKIEKQPEPKIEEKSEPEFEQLTFDIPAETTMPEVAKETVEETVKEPEPVEPTKTVSNDDRIAAIKAKLAALNKK